jgi:hypothetical protein
MDMAASVASGTTTLTPKQPNSKKAKTNGQRKDDTKKKVVSNAPKSSQHLSQLLGDAMADQLVNNPRPTDPLDLVGRLVDSQNSTIVTATTTTIVTEDSVTVSTHTNTRVNHPPKPSATSYASPPPKWKKQGTIFNLDDFAAMTTLESLVDRFGRVSHMGILDKSYNFFLNKARDAALYFKVKNKIAVVGGDPLCKPEDFTGILREFKEYRKKLGLGIAFLGASDALAKFARQNKWITLHFGEERVLNPMTNPVLQERSGKRIVSQNKQLLDPSKGGITLEAYSPASGKDPQLEEQLIRIYDDWRAERNEKGGLQAFITVYDPFALPALMTYIYTKGPDGIPNGFAALRKLGANNGFHIDPCIAAPGAPRGTSDLLMFSAMALLNRAGISYLSLGYEPMLDLGDIDGMPKLFAKASRATYRRTFRKLPVGGKKAYHDKFRPDESQQSGLHIVFPDGIPGPRHSAAVMHVANISMRQLLTTRRDKSQDTPDKESTVKGNNAVEKEDQSQSRSTSSEETLVNA